MNWYRLSLYKQYFKLTEYVKNLTTSDKTDVKYPTMDDLTGAAQALSRLQNIYHLQVKDLAKGKLNGLFLR